MLTATEIHACLAIACPTDHDLISMTNLPWQFSQKELQEKLNFKSLTFINDYTAIAMAIPLLNDEQKIKIGGGEAIDNKPISVCGPGTGLGVATLVPLDNKWHCISGEGGHMDYAPVDSTEVRILQYLQAIKGRVSYEQLLSGYGLEQIHQAITANQSPGSVSKDTKPLTAAEISEKALSNECTICFQALALFCNVLGSFAGNLALLSNSTGGVYIAGGIVPRFIKFFKVSGFRERFEAKGRLSHIPKHTPTYIITEMQPGLLGASAYLNQTA
jgi:glucokinase